MSRLSDDPKVISYTWEELQPRTDAEIAAGVTPVNFRYPELHICRYGARETSAANPTAGFDSRPAFANAALVAAQVAKPVLAPAGHWYISAQVDLTAGLCGDGIESTFIHYPSGAKGFYMVGSSTAFRDTLMLRDFTLVGPLADNLWPADTSPSVEDAITAAYYSYVFVDNVHIRYSRNISLHVTWCGVVSITNYKVEFSGRDGAYISGCNKLVVNGYFAQHTDDDALSFHETPNNTDFTPPSADVVPSVPQSNRAVLISDVMVVDGKGIKSLGAVNTKISNYIGVRVRERGLLVGGYSTTEGLNDPVGVTVENVALYDVIDGAVVLAAGGNNESATYAGIAISSDVPSTGGGATAVPPGQFDAASGAFVLPDSYYYSTNTSDDVPRGGAFFVHLRSCKVYQTLPDTAHYSDWGVGKVWTGAGWVDPVMTGHSRTLPAVQVDNTSSALHDLDIELNAYNVLYGVDLSRIKKAAWTLSNARLRLKVIRCADSAVYLNQYTSGTGGNTIPGLLDISGHFDLDPYFESSNRTASGGWTSLTSGGPYVVNLGDGANMHGLVLHDSVFRNLSSPIQDMGHMASGSMGLMRGNTYVCQPDTSGDHVSTGNKGIGDLASLSNNRFVFEDSDPTSDTYGQSLGAQGIAEFDAMPSSGFYMKGQVVVNRNVTVKGTTAAQYVVTGWKRLTSGDEHTLNTDWVELRSLTGT